MVNSEKIAQFNFSSQNLSLKRNFSNETTYLYSFNQKNLEKVFHNTKYLSSPLKMTKLLGVVISFILVLLLPRTLSQGGSSAQLFLTLARFSNTIFMSTWHQFDLVNLLWISSFCLFFAGSHKENEVVTTGGFENEHLSEPLYKYNANRVGYKWKKYCNR